MYLLLKLNIFSIKKILEIDKCKLYLNQEFILKKRFKLNKEL